VPISLLLFLAMLAGPRVQGRAELLLADGGSIFERKQCLYHKELIDCQRSGNSRKGALWPVKNTMHSSG